MSSGNMPLKCGECSKSSALRYHRKCRFCQNLEFEETILCDLNRAVQEMNSFECHAFEPRLRVVNPDKIKIKEPSPIHQHTPRESYHELFNSDKIKYQRALALQKLKRDPDAVFVQLKYHLSWNVFQRIPVFIEPAFFIEPLTRIFNESSTEAGGFVHLLHLAPDHVHIFLESDGELSIEEIIDNIKKYTSDKISEEYPILEEKTVENNGIWDDAYFAETVW